MVQPIQLDKGIDVSKYIFKNLLSFELGIRDTGIVNESESLY